jgi:hypothetical protein
LWRFVGVVLGGICGPVNFHFTFANVVLDYIRYLAPWCPIVCIFENFDRNQEILHIVEITKVVSYVCSFSCLKLCSVSLFVHSFVRSCSSLLFFFPPKQSYGALKLYNKMNKTNKTNKINKTNRTNKTNKTKQCSYPSQLPDSLSAC